MALGQHDELLSLVLTHYFSVFFMDGEEVREPRIIRSLLLSRYRWLYWQCSQYHC
jgi:hypothetical protein